MAAVLGSKIKYRTESGLVLTLGSAPSTGTFMRREDGTFELGAFQVPFATSFPSALAPV